MWYVCSNLTVTEVKYSAPYIILWVENASRSQANLYFTEGMDVFNIANLTGEIELHNADYTGRRQFRMRAL